jgi:hypothetical protein
LTINNHAHLVGDINVSNAVINNASGADWQFGGTNVFAAGFNVIHNDGTILSQSSAGAIQITAGFLGIFGTIQGVVNLAIGNGATLELENGVSAGQTVTFLGTEGTLKLDHALTSPFTGQLSNLTGTSLIHDNIDLADMVWSATASAHYVASTATSGALTVNDGAGHSVVLQLINYSGDGTFNVQNDGNGGTLVFDPPVAPASSDSVPEALMDPLLEKFSTASLLLDKADNPMTTMPLSVEQSFNFKQDGVAANMMGPISQETELVATEHSLIVACSDVLHLAALASSATCEGILGPTAMTTIDLGASLSHPDKPLFDFQLWL